jgi:hypothetical protein
VLNGCVVLVQHKNKKKDAAKVAKVEEQEESNADKSARKASERKAEMEEVVTAVLKKYFANGRGESSGQGARRLGVE